MTQPPGGGVKKLDKYVLMGLWAAVALVLVWFVASKWSIYALLLAFALTAIAICWWGLRLDVSQKTRRIACNIAFGFWTAAMLLLFFPFPIPGSPEYVVGEVHRFSEMEEGFARAFMGVLGPNAAHHGLVYTNPEEIEGLGQYGAIPTFVTTTPLVRATFGGNNILDQLRAPSSKGGDPVKVMPYPGATWTGEHREHKIGWNKGDMLLGDVAKAVGHEKATYDPHENTLMIEDISKWMGSLDTSIAAVDPRFFYSHDLLSGGTPLDLNEVKDMKYAIQVFTDQNWDRVHNDPGSSWWSSAKSGVAYSTSAWIAVRMAEMLRDMGYNARVGFGGINYDTAESPFSVYGGKGEYGRLSDAVVPTAGGLRFKSAVILTDFPLEPGKPKGYGITRMCEHCDRCARACPVSSIPMGEMTVENGVKMWQVDKDKCVRFRTGNLNGNCCNECLRVCPYNKPSTPFHKVGNYIIRHSPIAPYLFGNINGLGLEDWLDYEVSAEAGPYNVNRPARWVMEELGFKMKFPYMMGKWIYTEEDRSPDEDWASGIGAKMGKVGLTYKGVQWGKIPERLLDKDGRNRNVHWDYAQGELPHNLALPGKVLTVEEAEKLLKSGQAFTGGSNHADNNVYPPRSKYEHGFLKYDEAVKMWQNEK